MMAHSLHRLIAGACMLGFVTTSAQAELLGTLETTDPFAQVFVFGDDFTTFTDNGNAVEGDVTARVDSVDFFSTDSGCEAADFAGFVAGSIALVLRGTCEFSTKTNNAAAAGAVGIVIADNSATFPAVALNALTAIPALFIKQTLGDAWANEFFLTVHMTVSRQAEQVAAPSPIALLALALMAMMLPRPRTFQRS